MEATADPHPHHHHHEEVEVNPATWKDPKRYAWLLGILIPLAPFMAWGWVSLTGIGAFWYLGPALVFVAFPLLDFAIGMDATNPPDSVLKWLEQDRYYRWCTYLFSTPGWCSPVGFGPAATSPCRKASGWR
jgi:alkane 1-monooxygenase